MTRNTNIMLQDNWDEDEEQDADSEPQHITGEVITLDEQLLERLEQLERLLRDQHDNPAARLPAVRKPDDFSLSASDNKPEEILIRVRDRLQNMQDTDAQEDSLQDDIGRALLTMLGASYGAQLAGPTGAGVGAAIASFLHSRKKVNPLEILFGRREE